MTWAEDPGVFLGRDDHVPTTGLGLLDVTNGVRVDEPHLRRPVEGPLNGDDRSPLPGLPARLRINPALDVEGLQGRDREVRRDASRRTTGGSPGTSRRCEEPDASRTSRGRHRGRRGRSSRTTRPGCIWPVHELVVTAKRLVLVRAEVDLLLANLDEPASPSEAGRRAWDSAAFAEPPGGRVGQKVRIPHQS